MGEFVDIHKNHFQYLDVAANGNGDEKASLTLRALERINRVDAHLIEIGPGGGAAINALSNSLAVSEEPYNLKLSLVEKKGIESAALAEARARFDNGFGVTEFYKADARELSSTFAPDSADIIIGSAVMHEIYSYGQGYLGVRQAIGGIANTLVIGGFFAHRDVFTVRDASLHEHVRQSYGPPGWLRFIKNFVPHYLENATHPYHHIEDELTFRQGGGKIDTLDLDVDNDVVALGPVGLFRELQRHYITFRDNCWRMGALGVVPELEGSGANDWLDIQKGHKRVHYSLSEGSFLTKSQLQLLEAMSEKIDDCLVIDGDIFDAVSDIAMNDFFISLEMGGADATKVWVDWIEREGSESYAYMTTGQFIGAVALNSLELDVSSGDSVLLPIYPEDVTVVPRAYYNRLLEKRLSNPLFDGKQLILFQKIALSDTDNIQRGLKVAQEHCSRDTLAKLYSHISRNVPKPAQNGPIEYHQANLFER